MTDVYLKIKTAQGNLPDAALRRIPDQAVDVLKDNGLGLLLSLDAAGNDVLQVASRDVAVNFIQDYVVTPGTYDDEGNEITPPVFGGPLLMIRFHSPAAEAAWETAGDITSEYEEISKPGTIGGWL